MTRRRYIQVGLELVEVGPDYAPDLPIDSGVLWNDRQYQDCGDARFKSRTEHREYLRSRGLTTMDDFKGEWAEARRMRDEFYTRAPDPTRAHDVARAAEQVASGHKPNRKEEL